MAMTPDGFFDAALQPSDATVDARKEFRSLLERVRQGSEEAAWDLIEVYGPHILRVVRRKLNARMRPKFDSTDFVQAVWASFFTSRSQILRFNQPEELIAFLAAMARNKVITEVRRRLIHEKYNIINEEPLHDSTLPAPTNPHGHQPTPSQVAVARERWQRMVAGQSPQHRKILYMRYMGETYEEIAEKLGMHERTVRKIVEQALSQ
jgi:RNA polymerase sigma-70 factor (ECF subfamily)